MKNTIFSFLTAAGLLFAGCHQPDELLPSVSRNGINSVTAQFVKNNSEGAAEFYGEFKGYPAEGSDEITVEIPWFYPESSDDVVSGKMLDKMRRQCYGGPCGPLYEFERGQLYYGYRSAQAKEGL